MNKVEQISEKISFLDLMPMIRILNLPSENYGPFCAMILNHFIEYHKLSKDLALPSPGIPTHVALSRIFDIILHSMGDDKRKEILNYLDEYNLGLQENQK